MMSLMGLRADVRNPRRLGGVAGALAALLALATGCGDPFGPPYACEVPVAGGCWTALGLTGWTVTSLAETPWGLTAGTAEDGVRLRDRATGTWDHAGLSGAAVLSMLYVDRRGRLFVGTITNLALGAGFFATTDGSNWTAWGRGIEEQGSISSIFALAPDPRHANRLYLGTDFPIARSDNGGDDWYYVFHTRDTFGQGVGSLQVSRHLSDRVWASVTDGLGFSRVVRTDDGGGSWQSMVPDGSGGHVSAVLEDPGRPERVWASVAGRLYRSDDVGATWVAQPVDLGVITAMIAVGDRVLVAGSVCDSLCTGTSSVARFHVNGGAVAPDDWTVIEAPRVFPAVLFMGLKSDRQVLVGTRDAGVWALSLDDR